MAAEDAFDERQRFAELTADDNAFVRPAPTPYVPESLSKYRISGPTLSDTLRHWREALAMLVEQEVSRGTPFLFAPVFLGAGAIAYFMLAREPSLLVLLSAACLLSVAWWLRSLGGKRAWVTAVVALMACGATLAKLETIISATTMLGGEISTQADVRIRKVEPSGNSVRVIADVIATSRPTLKHAPRRIKVTLRNSPEGLKAGDMISARFGLQPPSGPVRPGGYDFAFHAWFSGIGANGYSMGKIVRLPDVPASRIDRLAFSLENARATIAQKVTAVLPGNDGAMAAALIAGVISSIDEETNEAMRLTGLAHIISISGLHMALVAGVFMVGIRLIFALFPAKASRLPVKKYGAAVALMASFFYLLLSGAGVATVRSFIMLAVMLVAVMLDRQALTLRNLAISAIAILVITPHEVMGPSFQMSFAATAALIAAYSYAAQRQQRMVAGKSHSIWQFGRNLVFGAVLTPVIAGLATAIFSAWHFHRLSPMGLPANLAAMPVVSLVVMPFGVISALAMPFGLEYWPLKIMGEGVHWMLAIARFFARLSPHGLTGAVGVSGFVTVTAAMVLACLLQSRLRLVGLAMLLPGLLLSRTSLGTKLMITEDSMLVAYAGVDGNLAVNRARPNGFTLQNWQRAEAAERIVKPAVLADEADLSKLSAAAQRERNSFVCYAGTCVLSTTDRKLVVWLEQQPDVVSPGGSVTATVTGKQLVKDASRDRNARSWTWKFTQDIRKACQIADIVITASPNPFRKCPSGTSMLITSAQLARKGVAQITFSNAHDGPLVQTDGRVEQATESSSARLELSNSAQMTIHKAPSDDLAASGQTERGAVGLQIRYAVGEPLRPWNRERIYSRAARNLAEFKPFPRKPKPAASLPAHPDGAKKHSSNPSSAERSGDAPSAAASTNINPNRVAGHQ